MIKLMKETLAEKKGREELSSERREIMVGQLKLLEGMVMSDKSSISSGLKNLDEEKLTFPKKKN